MISTEQTGQPDAIPPALAQELTRGLGIMKSVGIASFAGLGGMLEFMFGAVLRRTDLINPINPDLLDKALWTTMAVTGLALVDGGVQLWRADRQRGRIRSLAVQAIAGEGELLRAAFLASPLDQPVIHASSNRLAELAATTQGFFDKPNEPWLLAIGAVDQAHQALIDSITK